MYDASKDVVLYSAGSVTTAKGSIRVEVVSYNGGPAKVAMTEVTDRYTGKLGRVPVEHAAALAALLNKAAKWTATKGS